MYLNRLTQLKALAQNSKKKKKNQLTEKKGHEAKGDEAALAKLYGLKSYYES